VPGEVGGEQGARPVRPHPLHADPAVEVDDHIDVARFHAREPPELPGRGVGSPRSGLEAERGGRDALHPARRSAPDGIDPGLGDIPLARPHPLTDLGLAQAGLARLVERDEAVLRHGDAVDFMTFHPINMAPG
jgi:hypothetical protein